MNGFVIELCTSTKVDIECEMATSCQPLSCVMRTGCAEGSSMAGVCSRSGSSGRGAAPGAVAGGLAKRGTA